MKNIRPQEVKNKAIVILGPTASGKTALAVRLAARFNGEIISADSRQVYRGMDIGTGKDLREYRSGKKLIPYHLLDVVSPKTNFNLARYQKLAWKALADISARGALPLVVGGSGLYLQAVVDNYQLSPVKADPEKRRELEKRSVAELWEALQAVSPEFAAQLNNSDRHNPRRLVRYLELASAGQVFPAPRGAQKADFLVLGIDIPDDLMRLKIIKRLKIRLEKEDMIGEVERLHAAGVSYRRLISFGLEYKFVSLFLQGKMTREQLEEQLGTAIYRFAKRQKTWFKRWQKQGREIIWISQEAEAERAIQDFLKR